MKQSFRRGAIIITMLALFSIVAKPTYSEINKVSIEHLDKCVVAIGYNIYELNKGTGNIEPKRIYNGTGVLILAESGHYTLVTAKHVLFDDNGKVLPNLCFWGNKTNGEQYEEFFSTHQSKYKNIKWVVHPEFDIALTIVSLTPDENSISFVPLEMFEKIGDLKKGDNVYYLGYPFGIGAEKGGSPVRRRGMVAYKVKKGKFFYIDAMLSPGNSGGPVFKFDKETNSINLIGIVSAFRKLVIEGNPSNSGLGIVFSADCIRDLLDSKMFRKTM